MSQRRARVVHSIGYRFEEPVAGADLVLRLSPRRLPDQEVSHQQIIVEPRPPCVTTGEDDLGNPIQRLTLSGPLRTLEIRSVSTVARSAAPMDPLESCRAARDVLSRCGVSPAVPPFPDLPRGGREACRLRSEAILQRLRSHGVECRYMAGYPWLGRRGATLPHAWVSLLVPGHGWIELDGLRDELRPGHVVLGWGRGYDDTAPVLGSLHASGRYRLVSSVSFEPLP